MFSSRTKIRTLYIAVLTLAILAAIGITLLLISKTNIFRNQHSDTALITPFPVSVNSYTQVIEIDPTVEQYFSNSLALAPNSTQHWWNKVAAVLSTHNWYQNLASPISRIVVIWPGDRKEEVVKHIGDIVDWDKSERAEFTQLIDTTDPILKDGKYFPGQYVTHRDATPQEIQQLIITEFNNKILARYTPEVDTQVPLKDALIIASLLEREASDFTNMRAVSGVIWNRLFINMPLQLDATLQYVQGSKTSVSKWWPKVHPNDKFTASAYNTYQNKGLPPAPIANPSPEAVLAALNPIQTDCLYYFHTSDGGYYCSVTYEEHVSKLKEIYGHGS